MLKLLQQNAELGSEPESAQVLLLKVYTPSPVVTLGCDRCCALLRKAQGKNPRTQPIPPLDATYPLAAMPMGGATITNVGDSVDRARVAVRHDAASARTANRLVPHEVR